MKVSIEPKPGLVMVTCRCGYEILWETSCLTDLGEREKIVWVDGKELGVKPPAGILLTGIIREDDHSGCVGLRCWDCEIISDGKAEKAGDDVTRKMGFLLDDMWEPLPKIPEHLLRLIY